MILLAFFLAVYSMEGGELFDRIQKKGHFTERGKAARKKYMNMHIILTLPYRTVCVSIIYKVHVLVKYMYM
jgi:hypothetical protein